VIFVTVGTHHQPFTRLLDALGTLDPRELVVQHGYAPAPEGVAEAAAFVPFSRMVEYFASADAVVTHAGVGSILSALRAGHTPVVVPRREHLGEHVDDHQVELVRALAGEGRVEPVWDVAELPRAVASAKARVPALASEAGSIHAAVRGALLDPR